MFPFGFIDRKKFLSKNIIVRLGNIYDKEE